MGETSYAANTGLSSPVDGRNDRSDDNPDSIPSSNTDIEGRIGSLSDEVTSLDTPIILLEHGSVIVANDIEDPPRLGSSSSQDDPIGFSIEVSSNIGSRLLVPSEYTEKSFAVDSNGYLIGIRSATISCYIGNYTVRFPSYGQPQYRLTSGSSYTWTDINISYVGSSNVEVVGDRFNWYSNEFRTLIEVACLCFLLILAFRRRD